MSYASLYLLYTKHYLVFKEVFVMNEMCLLIPIHFSEVDSISGRVLQSSQSS